MTAQFLDAQGRVPRGEACLGISAEVARDDETGLVVGMAYRERVGPWMGVGVELPEAFPPGDPDDLMLAVAWGAGPDGADVGELDDSYRRTWVPAVGLLRTQTWVPEPEGG